MHMTIFVLSTLPAVGACPLLGVTVIARFTHYIFGFYTPHKDCVSTSGCLQPFHRLHFGSYSPHADCTGPFSDVPHDLLGKNSTKPPRASGTLGITLLQNLSKPQTRGPHMILYITYALFYIIGLTFVSRDKSGIRDRFACSSHVPQISSV